MRAVVIDGRKVADSIKGEVREKVSGLGGVPCLCAILVGDDPASHAYVKSKKKACESLGMRSDIFHLPVSTPQADLKVMIHNLNARHDVNGILVQLPLPAHFGKYGVINLIDPLKDVDGLTPHNLAGLDRGQDCLEPCTPKGILALLDYRDYRIPVEGMHAVIVGRSDIVGKPLQKMMLSRNATVTLCHSRTRGLEGHMRAADILVSAVGKPGWVRKEMVREGAVVIDVGINRVEDRSAKSGYRLVGDVDFDGVAEVAGYITPVPGGVGPMTIACLMDNTLRAYNLQNP